MPGEHGTIETTTYATLEDGNNVEIPEVMVRKHYKRERITDTLVNKLKEDLKDKEIEYEHDEDGNGTLTGDLGTYI